MSCVTSATPSKLCVCMISDIAIRMCLQQRVQKLFVSLENRKSCGLVVFVQVGSLIAAVAQEERYFR